MTKVKICQICATENDPSAIECVSCMGDISGIRPMSKDELAAEKIKDYDWDELRTIAQKTDETGVTELMRSVFCGDLEAIKILIRADADINAKANDGSTPVFLAVVSDNIDALKILTEAGADTEAKLKGKITPLLFAAHHNKFEAVKALIEAGADINATDGQDITPLLAAINNDADPKVIMTIIQAGADVNARHTKNIKPLTTAIRHNAAHGVIKALIEAGADPNLANIDGLTPFTLAISTKTDIEIINSLIAAKADVNAENADGLTPLMLVALKGSNPEVINALVQAGANVNAIHECEEQGYKLSTTPLMFAARNNPNPEIVMSFIKAGGKTIAGTTALIEAAAGNPNPDVIRIIINAGVNINATDDEGLTALQVAKAMNRPQAIIAALKEGKALSGKSVQEIINETKEAATEENATLEQKIAGIKSQITQGDTKLEHIDRQMRNLKTELDECQKRHDHHINVEHPRQKAATRQAAVERGGMTKEYLSILTGISPYSLKIAELKEEISKLEAEKASIKKEQDANRAKVSEYTTQLKRTDSPLNSASVERSDIQEHSLASKKHSISIPDQEILKRCTDFTFLKDFLMELEKFADTTTKIVTRAAEDDRVRHASYEQEQKESMLAIKSKQKDGVNELINKKSAALRQYEAEIQALNGDDDSIKYRKNLYDEIFDRKRTSSGNIEQLRDDLFDQEEAISEERDLAWDEYQLCCEEILEERTAQEEYDKKNISRSVMEQAAALQRYKRDKEARRRDTEKKIDDEIARFTEKFNPANIREQYARIYAEEPFAEDYQCKTDNPDSVRIATLQYDLSAMNLGEHAKNLLESYYPVFYRHGKLQVPFCVAFDESFNYSFEVSAANRAMFIDKARSLAMRLFMMIPPNKINFTFVDPITLGDTFSLFTNLVDVDDRTSKVINGQIWTAAADVEDRLRVLTSHISNVNQRCLQGRYKNIQEYNKSAGQNAEPYQVLMIMDFPAGLKEDSLRMLEQIISTGPKCGVYTMLFKTEEQINKITDGKILALIENIEAKTIRFASQGNELFFAGDSIQLSIPDSLSENELQLVIPRLKDGIKNADKMVIKFDERKEILPDETEWLTGNSSSELVIPLGIHGANNVQNLVFGNSAYHALIIGQTGSGKSSLLHTMIMSSLIRYSADELNIFLIDFKRGVEFKIYANHRLESFRAVAIESEREFGDSVLAFLDQEQSRRAELFRRENVDNIHAYRAKQDKDGKNFILPRILLIIDEFHVLFSGESDSTGKNASIHLEQIIKQGRAFGIHVILSSQTMASVGGIHQSLWGQVGIRIALKCPQADAKLILADDNDGVDLLSASEPGAAVYNSDCGNKTANTIFRVAYIEQEAQSELLEKISGKALKLAVEGHISRPQAHHESALTETRVMVSNIEDNLYHPYQTFINGGNPKEFEENAVLIGEPLQLSGKLRTGFKPKEASNMLIIGKDEQKARAMFTFSALSLAIHSLAVNDWQTPSSACLNIVNFVPPEYGDDTLISLKDNISRYSNYCDFDGVADMLGKIHASLKNRSEKSESQYLLLFGLQRARNLRQGVEIPQSQKNFDDGLSLDIGPKPSPTPTHTPYQMFLNILREGPQKNIHTIAWIDNFKIFQEYYPGWLDEFFGLRVGFTMPNDDSLRFMEEPDGSKISESNAIFSYNGNQKFRPYKMPGSDWLKAICGRINSF